MTFHREYEMTVPVLRWLRQLGLEVKQEFSIPWGICDVVGVSLDPARVKKRLELRQYAAIGPLRRVSLLQHIPDKETGHSITATKLRRLVGDCEFFDTELEKLIKSGFVNRRPRNLLHKLNGWFPLHERFIAVELKLSRISEALTQASSNLAFAAESFVAMPSEIALRITQIGPRREEFWRAGVGILAVTKKECRVVLPASGKGMRPDPVLQMHCVERFWRTLKDSST